MGGFKMFLAFADLNLIFGTKKKKNSYGEFEKFKTKLTN